VEILSRQAQATREVAQTPRIAAAARRAVLDKALMR
jgi:hypothetical protein